MVSRMVSGGVLAAIAGAAMLAVSAGPSAAFTLSAPSLEQPVVSNGVEPVWWDAWGRWHPNRYYHRYYYRPYYHHYYYRPYYYRRYYHRRYYHHYYYY